MSKWICQICGYVYDEEKEGVPFSLFPDSWVCPLCGADKASFSPGGRRGGKTSGSHAGNP